MAYPAICAFRTLLIFLLLGFSGCLPLPGGKQAGDVPVLPGAEVVVEDEEGEDALAADEEALPAPEEEGIDPTAAQTQDCWGSNLVPSTHWTTLSSLNQPRSGHAMSVVGCLAYVFGGSSNGQHLNSVEIYDPAVNAWQFGPSMPASRYGLASAVSGGKIYILGGEEQSEGGFITASAVLEFDPTTNSWSNCGGECAAMPTPRFRVGSATIDDVIYVQGELARTVLCWKPFSRR